jgi:GNAT superfamily N-acetyltransferase
MSDADRKLRLVKAASHGGESVRELPEALDLEFIYPRHRVVVADTGPDTYIRSIRGTIEFSTAYEDKETGEYGEWRTEVGRFHALYVAADLASDEGARLSEVMAAESPEMREIYNSLYDRDAGELRKEVSQRLGGPVGRNLLVVHDVEILPAHRGKGLGLAVMWYLIRLHSAGCGVVAIQAVPAQFRAGFDPKKDELRKQMAYDSFPHGREAAQRKLVSRWERLGFTEFGDAGVMALNASLRKPVPEESRHWVPRRLSGQQALR